MTAWYSNSRACLTWAIEGDRAHSKAIRCRCVNVPAGAFVPRMRCARGVYHCSPFTLNSDALSRERGDRRRASACLSLSTNCGKSKRADGYGKCATRARALAIPSLIAPSNSSHHAPQCKAYRKRGPCPHGAVRLPARPQPRQHLYKSRKRLVTRVNNYLITSSDHSEAGKIAHRCEYPVTSKDQSEACELSATKKGHTVNP